MSTNSIPCLFCAQTVDVSRLDKCHNKTSQLTIQQIHCLKQMLTYLTGGEQLSPLPPINSISDILKLWTSSSHLIDASGDFIITQLCDDCNLKVQKFVKLHLKLEYLWLNINNLVKSMQGLIINSKLNSTGFTNNNKHDTIDEFQTAVLCAVNQVNLKASWNMTEALDETQVQPIPPPKSPDITVPEPDEDVVSITNSVDIADNDEDSPDAIDATSLPEKNNQTEEDSFDFAYSQSYRVGIKLVVPVYKPSDQPNNFNLRRRYCCGQCEDEQGNHKSFETESQLRQHIAEQHTGQIFICKICDKVFSKNYTLQEHQKIHSGNGYKCEKCGKIFSLKSQWTKHVKYGHLEERNFVCKICGKSFRSPDSLSSHQSSHKDEKIFECQLCSRKLKTSGTFKTHMRTHTAQRNVPCDLCWMKFTSESAVRSHQKRVHSTKQNS